MRSVESIEREYNQTVREYEAVKEEYNQKLLDLGAEFREVKAANSPKIEEK